ncbi:MAG: 7TM receptor with intracellular HD hydrolase [Candidatus Omnitrophica bacterium ADurb.Bin277]|nr:MAG: 7TM receptor with intracellular HD hydrolase [Candidatus Omnitrophica bacterium ADurb.Bin277]
MPSPDKAARTKATGKLIPSGIFAVGAVLACLLLFWNRPWTLEQQEFLLGEPSLRSYFAPLSFTFVDEKRTESVRAEKLKELPPAYRIDPAVTAEIRELHDRFWRVLIEVQEEKRKTGETRWKELPIPLPTGALDTLLSSENLPEFRSQTAAILDAHLSLGIWDHALRQRFMNSNNAWVLITNEDGREERRVAPQGLLTVDEALRNISGMLPPEIDRKKQFRSAVLQVFENVVKTNVVADDEKVLELRKKALLSVLPVEITVKKNELIVQKGMLVTEKIKGVLDHIHQRLAARKQQIQIVMGVLLITLLYLFSALYLAAFEPGTFYDRDRLLLFQAVLLIGLGLSKLVTVLPDVSIYLMPTALISLLLTLLFHNRIGILGGVIMTVMSGFLSGFRIDIMLATLFASLASTILAHRVLKRSHFLRIGLGIGAAYFLVITSYQIAQNLPWREAVQFGFLGFLNALFTAVASYLVLPVLEHFFDAITDVTLLELSDLNHPLMRRMMVEAPGTYHHSLMVSSLAENACERIGAHALRAKVGCYFHDIGKLEKPEYFTENQGHLYANCHENLSPRVSFETIVNHVRDGVRIAKKYKLRRAITDFIREHQGTGVIYYFFKKATDMAAPKEQVRVDDFRYPGPKPQSRETAVALLADSTEAACRALKDPTPDSIQQLVRKVINDKFIDGQLDECELTLQDLHKIQASFFGNLTAMFHTRLKYPTVERPAMEPDIFGKNQFHKFRADE